MPTLGHNRTHISIYLDIDLKKDADRKIRDLKLKGKKVTLSGLTAKLLEQFVRGKKKS